MRGVALKRCVPALGCCRGPPSLELIDRAGEAAAITGPDARDGHDAATDQAVGVLPQLPLRPARRTDGARTVFSQPQRALR